jgi:hypothetical protein
MTLDKNERGPKPADHERDQMPELTISHPTNRPNFSEVTFGEVTVWFSYSTAVAVMSPTLGQIVRANEWGPTTGRHLSFIDGGSAKAKAARVESETFVRITDRIATAAGVASDIVRAR